MKFVILPWDTLYIKDNYCQICIRVLKQLYREEIAKDNGQIWIHVITSSVGHKWIHTIELGCIVKIICQSILKAAIQTFKKYWNL